MISPEPSIIKECKHEYQTAMLNLYHANHIIPKKAGITNILLQVNREPKTHTQQLPNLKPHTRLDPW